MGVLIIGVVGVLGGVFEFLDFIQVGLRSRSRSMDIVFRFAGILEASGLSLGLFRTLPFGGLTPRFGVVVMLSILGRVYGPKRSGLTFM